MKTFIKAIAILFSVILVIGAGVFTYVTWGMKKIQNQTINAIDISHLSDGKYTGTYENARWSNTVEVVVKEGEIISINILDDVAMPLDGVKEQIIAEVLKKQNLDVDAISSATATSHAYLKAIEAALDEQ